MVGKFPTSPLKWGGNEDKGNEEGIREEGKGGVKGVGQGFEKERGSEPKGKDPIQRVRTPILKLWQRHCTIIKRFHVANFSTAVLCFKMSCRGRKQPEGQN
jgi:hypothetical protein